MSIRKGSFIKGMGVVILLAMAVFFIMPVGEASADMFSYSAKFVCGKKSSDTGAVKGMYSTGVNIHNPQVKPVQFAKKAVIANPERSVRGPISQIVNEYLLPDQAMEVDCTDITTVLFKGVTLPSHIEGFVVIMVPIDTATGIRPELDVVGKVTARHRTGTGGAADVTTDVESIDIEYVPPRYIIIPVAGGSN